MQPIKAWIFGTEYTGAVSISSSRFDCTIVEPYDTNRGYTIKKSKEKLSQIPAEFYFIIH